MIKSSVEGIQVTDYQNDEVQDNVLQACLSCFYRQFVLRQGRLKSFYETQGLPNLKTALRKFFDKVGILILFNDRGVCRLLEWS